MKLTKQEIARLDELNRKDMESYILKVSGEKVPVTPKNGTDFDWREIIGHLTDAHNTDPTMTIVRLTKNRIMLAEDNGYALKLPWNKEAHRLYREVGGDTPIVGQVLVCPEDMVK